MKTLRLSTLALLVGLASASMAATPGSGLDLPNFDSALRAQDDLFLAANGKWLKRTAIPADKSSFGTFVQLSDLSDARLRSIVDALKAKPQAAGSVEQKIGFYYASFLDTAAIDKAGLKVIQPLLAEIDAIQTTADLARWLGQVQGRIATPVQLSVDSDVKNPSQNLTSTWQGGLGLPDRDYYLKTDDKRLAKALTAYQGYLTTLAKLSGEKQPAAAAQRVLAIEQRIAQAHWDQVANRDPVKTYNAMSVAELAALAPGLDWREFLKAAQLGSIERLSVSQPSTTTAIAKLVAELPLADWKLYAKLHSLDATANVLPKPFRAAHFAFHGTALSGAKVERPRWQQGIAELNGALGEAVGQVYVGKYFPPEYKARMQTLVGNLMAAYKASIDDLSWMSPETKARAQDKLSKYVTKIGYPDQWRDYSGLQVRQGDALGNALRSAAFEWQRIAAKADKPVDRKEWGMTPQTVNAYYNPAMNEIVFPAAILQPPFFDMSADDAANYGAIGAVIGHEISHGFDDQGSQFDGEGKLQDWWTAEDRKAFDAVTARLVAQYDAYEPLPGKHVNGKLTLGENIADLSGLQIAFKAYVHSLGGKPAPVLDGYTGEQRFFLGWAQAWRSKMREQRQLQLITVDPHSPAAARANGAAINNDGFHSAFGTKPGDKMYKPSADRIRLW